MPTWMITGCSSGLGRAVAQAVLQRGWNAVVTARDVATIDRFAQSFPQTALCLALDVRQVGQIEQAVASAQDRFGAIDVLVNNAGHGYRAAVEEGEPDRVMDMFTTNFFGAVALIKQVLPGMRARRSGAIVNVSSIAGRRSSPGSGYYSATKFALEGMSDALAKEVAPLGIKVMVVEPGAFRTEFAGRSLQQAGSAIADYAQTAGLRRKENDHTHGTQIGDPARAAQTIIETVTADKNPFRLIMGSDCLAWSRDELTNQLQELSDWEKVSVGTDFPKD